MAVGISVGFTVGMAIGMAVGGAVAVGKTVGCAVRLCDGGLASILCLEISGELPDSNRLENVETEDVA